MRVRGSAQAPTIAGVPVELLQKGAYLEQSYAGFEQLNAQKASPTNVRYLKEIAERLGHLYNATGQAALAAEWRQKFRPPDTNQIPKGR